MYHLAVTRWHLAHTPPPGAANICEDSDGGEACTVGVQPGDRHMWLDELCAAEHGTSHEG